MKGCGIVLLVFEGLNFIVLIIALSGGGPAEYIAQTFSAICMFTVLGAFLVSRANKKKREEEEREKWNKN